MESIPAEPNSIDEIINSLKSSIRPENSKVIAGRMMALRSDKGQLQDFTKQAEDLADALRRSLIVEGISHPKAHEMSVEKTVEMCWASAKTDLVKSILASTTFSDPKEVVAKFVVESATETKEKQIFAYKSQKFGNNKKRNSYSNNQKDRSNQYGRNNGRNSGNYGNNYNGKGNRRSYSDRGRGNGYNNNNGNNYGGNNGGNRYVRYTENSEALNSDA